jgi:uncharacterized protein
MRRFGSAQHRIFQADGEDFLFLAGESAIFQLDPVTRALLDGCPKDGLLEEELLTRLEGTLTDRRSRLAELVSRRLVVPVGVEPGEAADGISTPPVPVKTLVLQLTDHCNMRCGYCYHGTGQGRNGEGNGRMDLAVAERAVDFLISHSGDQKDLTLVFFGGEPLLQFPLMASLAPMARRKAAEAGKTVELAITTNGTLLTGEIISFLDEHRVGVTLSIDGGAEAHDRFRRLSDGSGSYGIVAPNVRKMLRNGSGKPAVARVTLAGSAGDVVGRVEHLLSLGFTEVGVSPVTADDPAFQLDEKEMDRLLHQFRLLAERLVEAAGQDRLYGFSNLIDLLVALHQGERKHHPCGAGQGLFSVSPRGELYACQRVTGESDFRMGSVFNGVDPERARAFRAAAHLNRKEACRECWLRMLCAGGCYHEAWVRQGSPFLANSHMCRWIERWIELGLEVYGRIFLTGPAYLDKLAVYRGQTAVFNHFYD